MRNSTYSFIFIDKLHLFKITTTIYFAEYAIEYILKMIKKIPIDIFSQNPKSYLKFSYYPRAPCIQ